MKAEDCPKLNECHKIKMILDKDILAFQAAEAIRAVCAECSGAEGAAEGDVDKILRDWTPVWRRCCHRNRSGPNVWCSPS